MPTVLWLIVPQLMVVGVAVWLYRMPDHGAIPAVLRSAWSRHGGEYHRMRDGKLWEPGERELYRGQVLGVTRYSVDRHVPIQGHATCIVTNRRIMTGDSHGRSIQLRAAQIRTVRPHRTHDALEGFAYWVVVNLVRSNGHDPEGDVRFTCASREQSLDLSSAINQLRSVVAQA